MGEKESNAKKLLLFCPDAPRMQGVKTKNCRADIEMKSFAKRILLFCPDAPRMCGSKTKIYRTDLSHSSAKKILYFCPFLPFDRGKTKNYPGNISNQSSVKI